MRWPSCTRSPRRNSTSSASPPCSATRTSRRAPPTHFAFSSWPAAPTSRWRRAPAARWRRSTAARPLTCTASTAWPTYRCPQPTRGRTLARRGALHHRASDGRTRRDHARAGRPAHQHRTRDAAVARAAAAHRRHGHHGRHRVRARQLLARRRGQHPQRPRGCRHRVRRRLPDRDVRPRCHRATIMSSEQIAGARRHRQRRVRGWPPQSCRTTATSTFARRARRHPRARQHLHLVPARAAALQGRAAPDSGRHRQQRRRVARRGRRPARLRPTARGAADAMSRFSPRSTLPRSSRSNSTASPIASAGAVSRGRVPARWRTAESRRASRTCR